MAALAVALFIAAVLPLALKYGIIKRTAATLMPASIAVVQPKGIGVGNEQRFGQHSSRRQLLPNRRTASQPGGVSGSYRGYYDAFNAARFGVRGLGYERCRWWSQ